MNVTIENRWQREYEIYCVKLKENKPLTAYSSILTRCYVESDDQGTHVHPTLFLIWNNGVHLTFKVEGKKPSSCSRCSFFNWNGDSTRFMQWRMTKWSTLKRARPHWNAQVRTLKSSKRCTTRTPINLFILKLID